MLCKARTIELAGRFSNACKLPLGRGFFAGRGQAHAPGSTYRQDALAACTGRTRRQTAAARPSAQRQPPR